MSSIHDIINEQNDNVNKAHRVINVGDPPAGGATELKQNEQIVELQAIHNLQENLDQLTRSIKYLAQAIANPSYVDKSANQMRAQVTGSVTATVASTALTTIDSYQGKLLMVGINNDAWANTCRRLIT